VVSGFPEMLPPEYPRERKAQPPSCLAWFLVVPAIVSFYAILASVVVAAVAGAVWLVRSAFGV